MEVINHSQRQAEVLDINGAKVCFLLNITVFNVNYSHPSIYRTMLLNISIIAFLMILCNINVYQIKKYVKLVIKIDEHNFCK